jgi:protein required for attachment to host cells
MSKLKTATGDWVVVCDGRKALILENIGDSLFPNLHTRDVKEHPVPMTREQGTDAPGRAFASVGAARSAMEQTDWHLQAEQEFLRRGAGELDRAVTSGQTKHIVVVAPPRSLACCAKPRPATCAPRSGRKSHMIM